MDAGSLDQRVILLKAQKNTLDSGEVVEVRVPFATRWAAVRPVRGTESWATQQRFAEVEVKFELRYRKELDATVAVRWNGVDHDVVEILRFPGGRPERMEILAKGRADEGGA